MSSSFESARRSFDAESRTWNAPLPPLDSPRTLVLCFGASHAEPFEEALQHLQDTYPSSVILGCSTAGEIHGTEVRDESLSVGIVRFAFTELASARVSITPGEASYDLGARMAKALWREDLRALLVLSDGLNVNGSALVRGVNSQLSGEVVVTGGLAGDGPRFEQTWVLDDGLPAQNIICAVGLYGDHLRTGHGSQGGWEKFGPVRTITRSEDNVLLELDGKPALALYKTYLGDSAKDLPASGLLFPISLLDLGSEERNVVRTLLSVDHDAQSLTFAGDVPEGTRIQLMRAHFDRLIEGARDAASLAAVDDLEEALVVAVSCVGRRLVLDERVTEELAAVKASLPQGASMVGFYSYGELSPVEDGRCDLHNQTMTLTILGESPTPLGLPLLKRPAPTAAPEPRAEGVPLEEVEEDEPEEEKEALHPVTETVTGEVDPPQEERSFTLTSTLPFFLLAIVIALLLGFLVMMQ